MRIATRSLLSGLLVLSVLTTASAQTIDAGRGEVPLYVPTGYDKSTPVPLVVLLHGYTSSGERQESYMKFGALADEYGYLFIAPDGTKEDSERAHRFWNASDACCNFFGSEVDDSAYVRGIIEKVRDSYTVDPNRVYLIGHSNGGFMSYRMAYDHSETIAAIASLAGASSLADDRPAPASPVHILQIHGTNDKTITYEGGDIGAQDYPSAEGSVKQWAGYNGCTAEAVVSDEKIDLDRRIDGNETTVTKFANQCKPGGSAELWSIEGGSHIPSISDSFTRHVIDWLFAHPKNGGEGAATTSSVAGS